MQRQILKPTRQIHGIVMGQNMVPRKSSKKRSGGSASEKSRAAAFAAMIEEATTDAHDESEQAIGWYTMFEDQLEIPFETTVFGSPVTVTSIELRDDNQIVAICKRGRDVQAVGIADLPLSSPKPAGAEWIAAYRYWCQGQ